MLAIWFQTLAGWAVDFLAEAEAIHSLLAEPVNGHSQQPSLTAARLGLPATSPLDGCHLRRAVLVHLQARSADLLLFSF